MWCFGCKTEKDPEAFNLSRSRPRGRQTRCRLCQSWYDKRVYRESATRRTSMKIRARGTRKRNAERVAAYLATHPCVDCGEADTIVLDFDHVRGTKRDSVPAMAKSTSMAWETIEAEIAKCEVRCSNCHRRVTHKRRQEKKLREVAERQGTPFGTEVTHVRIVSSRPSLHA